MTVKAEVIPGITMHVQSIVMQIESPLFSGTPIIHPESNQAGVLHFKGNPNQTLTLTLPDTIHLTSSRGSILMKDLTFAVADGDQPDQLRRISREQCRNLELPQSGHLILRIGGTLFLEYYLMAGTYQGRITISNQCID